MKLDESRLTALTALYRLVSDNDVPERGADLDRAFFVELDRLINDPEVPSLGRNIGYVYSQLWSEKGDYGFVVRGTGELVSDLLHEFENLIDSDLPASFSARNPALTLEQWQAAIRFTIDVMTILDRSVVSIT